MTEETSPITKKLRGIEQSNSLAASINRRIDAYSNFAELSDSKFLKITELLISSIISNKKIFTCGNGGSAAQAQHLTTELMVKFVKVRKAIPSVCLNTDTTLITAHSNDFNFEDIFSRQLSALASEGDMILAFSTSGESPNIKNALKMSKDLNMVSVLFTGAMKDSLVDTADVVFSVGPYETAIIQELHLTAIHTLCEVLDSTIF
jgi:D-sedoheptulose 7-phosphate isomerase